MKALNLIIIVLFLTMLFGYRAYGEIAGLDTYTITLSNKAGGTALNSPTNAANITVSPGGDGVAGLEESATFKANGAFAILTDVDTTNNIITVVWNGDISDGTFSVTGMLTQGDTIASDFLVTKVEKSGGEDITNQLDISVVLSSSQANLTPEDPKDPDEDEPEKVLQPKLTINSPSEIKVRNGKSLIISKIDIGATDFSSAARCTIKSSNKSVLRVRPRKFVLSSNKKSKSILTNVPKRMARKIARGKTVSTVDLEVNCSNDATSSFEVKIMP